LREWRDGRRVMKTLSLRLLLVLALGLVICLPGMAAADILTFSDTSSGDLKVSSSDKVYTDTMYVDQFDPSLGTLNQVNLEVANSLTHYVTFASSGYGLVTISYVLNMGSEIKQGAASLLNMNKNYTGLWYTTTFPASYTEPSVTDSQNANYPYLAADMAPFIGTGRLGFDVFTLKNIAFEFFPEGPSIGTLHSSYLSSVTVTYDYTPVPLPPSALLLGSGLLGLGALGWRRREG